MMSIDEWRIGWSNRYKADVEACVRNRRKWLDELAKMEGGSEVVALVGQLAAEIANEIADAIERDAYRMNQMKTWGLDASPADV